MAETVFSGANDSHMNSGAQSTFSAARGDASSTAPIFSTTATNYQFGVYAVKGGGRGSVTFSVVRSYFDFDLSSLSGTATSVDFKVYSDNLGSTSTNGSTAYLVEATALAGNNTDRGNIFSSGTTLGSSFGSFTISTTAGYHTLTLNSDGLTAVNNAIGSGTLTVGLMGYYDYNNTSPNTIVTTAWNKFHIYYSENASGGGTGVDPKLEITLAAAGYGHEVISVAAGSIGKINSVATANVGKVNTVD